VFLLWPCLTDLVAIIRGTSRVVAGLSLIYTNDVPYVRQQYGMDVHDSNSSDIRVGAA
jgi:hypothetical protein